MVRILTDDDLRDLGAMPEVVTTLEEGYRADGRGELAVLPRRRADLGGRGTAWQGAAVPARDLLGFRAYVYRPDGYDRKQQLVALYRLSTMELRALFVGGHVGALRTGAAVAAALRLAEPDLREVGLLGTGAQARNALAAMAAVFPLGTVSAWSRDPGHLAGFTSWARGTLGLDVAPVGSARELVARHSALVLTTSSETTVVSREMVESPKLIVSLTGYRRPEVDPGLFDTVDRVWTDSVAQASDAGTLFSATDRRVKLRPLGEGVEDGSARDRGRLRIVLNTGAAWQEVLVAGAMLDRAEATGRGIELPLAGGTDREDR